jgi:hypothetical protein
MMVTVSSYTDRRKKITNSFRLMMRMMGRAERPASGRLRRIAAAVAIL